MSVKTKRIILALVLVASVITIIGTVSFAYFTATGTSVNQTATISTAKVKAIFDDADTGVNAILNFGESFTKKFTITNDGNVPTHVKMYWKDLVNTYTRQSLSYTLGQSSTGDAGSYTVFVGGGDTKSLVPQSKQASTKLLANDIEVPVGTTYYELTVTLNYLSDVNQDSDLTAKFYTWFELQDINYKDNLALQTLQALNLTSKGPLTTGFDSPASTAESVGVYELADENDTTSYYFRGPVENNYVKFGKWNIDEPDVYAGYNVAGEIVKYFATLAACQADSSCKYNCTLLNRAGKDMYWRIIRINGDGSLRLIYTGTQAYANGAHTADTFIKVSQPFNALYDDAKYVGYMYSPANTTPETTNHSTVSSLANPNIASSDIKIILEEWYRKNLGIYDDYISHEAIFCYDRSANKGASGWSDDTGLGYGKNYTAYGAMNRFVDVSTGSWKGRANIIPTYVCSQDNDKFTSKNSTTEIGNKKLEYPVGLISADEIVTAGSGTAYTASEYYLKRRLQYWSGSPILYNGLAGMVVVETTGALVDNYVHRTEASVVPVINLTPEYAQTLIGDGTIGNEYRDSNE